MKTDPSLLGSFQLSVEQLSDQELIQTIAGADIFKAARFQSLAHQLNTRTRDQLLDIFYLVAVLDRLIVGEQGRRRPRCSLS